VEINNGFRELQHWQAVRPYAELAARSGTTLPEALERYVNIENVLRQDPVAGLLTIANNLGLSPQDLAQTFAAVAGTAAPAHAGGQQPEDPVLGAIAPVLQQLTQRQQAFESYLARQQAEAQQRVLQTAEQAIEAFASDRSNRYFADVEQEVTRLLQSGLVERTGDFARDLKTAYDLACRMNSSVHEQLVNERLAAQQAEKQQAAQRARQASRSLAGSAPESPPRRPSETDSIEDIVRAAYREAMGM
jgi:hypothetical protein